MSLTSEGNIKPSKSKLCIFNIASFVVDLSNQSDVCLANTYILTRQSEVKSTDIVNNRLERHILLLYIVVAGNRTHSTVQRIISCLAGINSPVPRSRTCFWSMTNLIPLTWTIICRVYTPKTRNTLQPCALAEPSGPWCLTFALGRLENLIFFIQIICWAPFNFP